jgi:signal transduction histidine kinase
VKPARGIQQKLVASSTAVLATALMGFLAAVLWINLSLAVRQKQEASAYIRNGLLAKGNILVSNNSQALQGMAAENGFLAVAALVASTVRDDEDVVYGIYMDDKRQPWVIADSTRPEGIVSTPGALQDTASLWAAGVQDMSHRRFTWNGTQVIEFVAPVKVDDRILGVVRYGLSTARMDLALQAASRASREALARTVAVLVLLGALALFFSYLGARRQARRITRPIEELQEAANAIARGDYARPVAVDSDDEIGLLAADFDSMRRTVKDYTERLEEMVAEKIQEIKDILDNIEQGLFTVDLKGKVNPDYALSTNAILDVPDTAKATLSELLRLTPAQEADWLDWLDMAAQRHASMRWDKLVRLCPVRELRLPDGGAGERIILVGYQKMFDRQKRLNKLMVLVQDVTDARRVERMIKEEKERHDNEVKAILGIVKHAAFIPDFLDDVAARLRALSGQAHRAPGAAPAARAELAAAMARDLHTLKGTAATYGFEALSRLARDAETLLEDLRRPDHPPADGEWASLARSIERMDASLSEIRGLVKSLTVAGAEAAVAVPGPRIRALKEAAAAWEAAWNGDSHGPAADAGRALARACRSIDYVRLDRLTERYRGMLQRVGERLGKKLEFRASPEALEAPPALFAALDEPLVHLLRNAADHGIEMEAMRLLHGKGGTGRITLSVESGEEAWEITVADDGQGIDGEALARKAVAKGLLSASAAAALSEDAKRELIFLPGLSSRDEATEISGMGVGMDAVAAWARSVGGSVAVASHAGQGTRITLKVPRSLAA